MKGKGTACVYVGWQNHQPKHADKQLKGAALIRCKDEGRLSSVLLNQLSEIQRPDLYIPRVMSRAKADRFRAAAVTGEEKHKTWILMTDYRSYQLHTPRQVCFPPWAGLHFWKMEMCQVPHTLVTEQDDIGKHVANYKDLPLKIGPQTSSIMSLRSLLEKQILRPRPRPPEPEPAFCQVNRMHIQVWEVLL